jgi:hypothetical protein
VLLDIHDPSIPVRDYARMTNLERDAIFKSASLNMFRFFYYPGSNFTDEQLEIKRVAEKSYITVYDHLVEYAHEIGMAEELQNI